MFLKLYAKFCPLESKYNKTKESSSPSVEISSSTTPVTENEKVAEFNEPESTIEVEVMEPRRSGRDRKQTKFCYTG